MSLQLGRAWRNLWPYVLVVLALMLASLPATGPWALAAAAAALAIWRRDETHHSLLTAYLGGFLLFVAVRALADDAGMPVAVDYPIRLDRMLTGVVPTVAWQAGRTGWKDVLATAIYLSYFLLPPTTLVLCWRVWPHRLRRYVYASLMVFAVAGAVHILLPTAPPWLAAAQGALPPVTQVAFAVFGEGNAVYDAGQDISGNYVAAMPSVHLAIATLVGLALRRTVVGWIAAGYVPGMLWAVVYGGEHYVCDGLAGIALAVLCWTAAARFGPVTPGPAAGGPAGIETGPARGPARTG